MATQTITKLIDDLDATLEATQTIDFTFKGVEYKIDLADKNAAAFEKALQKYVDAAQVTGKKRRQSKTSKTSDTAAIREWAEKHGHKVSARGRIAAETIQAFEASTMPKFSAAG